jgi:hypothetical protein
MFSSRCEAAPAGVVSFYSLSIFELKFLTFTLSTAVKFSRIDPGSILYSFYGTAQSQTNTVGRKPQALELFSFTSRKSMTVFSSLSPPLTHYEAPSLFNDANSMTSVKHKQEKSMEITFTPRSVS